MVAYLRGPWRADDACRLAVQGAVVRAELVYVIGEAVLQSVVDLVEMGRVHDGDGLSPFEVGEWNGQTGGNLPVFLTVTAMLAASTIWEGNEIAFFFTIGPKEMASSFSSAWAAQLS